MKLPDKFLTVNETCRVLGLTKTLQGKTLYQRRIVDDAIKTGRLKAYCLSRGKRKSKFVVHPDDLKRFLETCEYKERRIDEARDASDIGRMRKHGERRRR